MMLFNKAFTVVMCTFFTKSYCGEKSADQSVATTQNHHQHYHEFLQHNRALENIAHQNTHLGENEHDLDQHHENLEHSFAQEDNDGHSDGIYGHSEGNDVHAEDGDVHSDFGGGGHGGDHHEKEVHHESEAPHHIHYEQPKHIHTIHHHHIQKYTVIKKVPYEVIKEIKVPYKVYVFEKVPYKYYVKPLIVKVPIDYYHTKEEKHEHHEEEHGESAGHGSEGHGDSSGGGEATSHQHHHE